MDKIYWADRSFAKTLAYEQYQEHLKWMRQYNQLQYTISHAPVAALITLMVFPLFVCAGVYSLQKAAEAKRIYEEMKKDQEVQDMIYKASKKSFRKALREHDVKTATSYLKFMDSTISDMAAYAGDYLKAKPDIDATPPKEYRFAFLEQIYDRFYEPSFREFQSKQRPCIRYNGTCLEQFREQMAKQSQLKQQTPNAKSRTTAEAIEIVFTIGDMDNTGYENAFEDAKKAEVLLKDYCDHLLHQPNVCYITTKELNDPNWKPPFKNGLIILNLTLHADEATLGIHLTAIPYFRGCKCGPKVQASMGRAMAGMGYPSTWKGVLDENGERISKRNKAGEIVQNKDGSIRYKQESDGQGIIDWIEDQKRWIHKEMLQRYDWSRE